MSVVATDRTAAAARVAAMAQGGKCAGAAAGGGATEGASSGEVAHAAGARPIAADRKTASPLSLASVRRGRGVRHAARRRCGGAGGWFIGMALFGCGAEVLGRSVPLSAPAGQRR